MNDKSQNIIGIAIFAVVALGIIIFSIADYQKQETQKITGFAVKDPGMTFCNNYEFEDNKLLAISSLRSCARYKDTILAEMARLGLLDLGIDPLLIISLAQQESSCNPQDARGLLQVDDCANGRLDCPDENTRIREGLKIFKSYYEALKAKGIVGDDLLHLTLFAYNRGLGTSYKAIEKINQGEALRKAMEDSCAEVFSRQCYGTSVYCRYTLQRKDKCVDEGLGAGYPAKILERYKANCKNLGGNFEQGFFSYSKTSIKKFGIYEISPGFSVTKSHNIKIYDELWDFSDKVIKECTENVGACVEQKKDEFNQNHEDIQFKACGYTAPEKVFYKTLEKIHDCFEANHSDSCVCSITEDFQEEVFRLNYGIFFEELPISGEEGYYYGVNIKSSASSLFDSLVDIKLAETHILHSGYELGFSEIKFKYGEDNGKKSFESKTDNLKGLKNLYLYLDDSGKTPKYLLVGINNNGNLVSSNGYLNIDAESVGECPANKTKYVFCAYTEESMINTEEYQDFYTKKTSQQAVEMPLIIRFSLYLEEHPKQPENNNPDEPLDNQQQTI